MEKENKIKSSKLADYWPLASLILVAVLAGGAVCFSIQGEILDWMRYFMGFLFCQFSLLKLFDIPGFADGFQRYDLIAKKSRLYAFTYPWIELVLGLAFLSAAAPVITYLATVILMTIGATGVILGLKKGLDIYCPCMGSVLKVPLSTVTLIEDVGMGLMALIMLFSHGGR